MSGAFKPQATTYRPQGDSENITVTAASAQSASMPGSIESVRLSYKATTAGAPCYVKLGDDPTAASDGTSMMLIDGATEYLRINAGEKVAVIGTDGTLNITPMTK